jgi:(p)ppGpp synthase/HD superfamily hydrolase
MVTEIEKEMARFAALAHATVGQLRKHTFEPYIVHPTNVAALVRGVGGTPEMICAAYGHDLIEDANVTAEEIEARFGKTIAEYIVWLTDVYVLPEHGNRKERKAKELIRLKDAPAQVMTIKLADLIDNTASVTEYDPKFAATYMREKMEALPYFKSGNRELFQRACGQLIRYYTNQNDFESSRKLSDLFVENSLR